MSEGQHANPLSLGNGVHESCIYVNFHLGIVMSIVCPQCFDTVGWAAGRASGL